MATFFLDHNVAQSLGTELESIGHVAHLARVLNLTRVPDYELLSIAFLNRWIIVTHNRNDFVLLHGAWQNWATLWGLAGAPEHAGILVLPGPIPPRRAANEVASLLRNQASVANRLFQWHRDRGWIEGT